VLASICLAQPGAFAAAEDLLLVDDTQAAAQPPSDGAAEAHAAVPKRRRYEVCINCRKDYDVTSNCRLACVSHQGKLPIHQICPVVRQPLIESLLLTTAGPTGDLEVDWEGGFWDDHDEECHGRIDTDDMRRECPDGFVWNCCDRKADNRGCTMSAHVPKRTSI
jgi:hypothetical protein